MKRWSDHLLVWTDRFRWFVPVLILLVYLAGFTGVWRPEPDAALYLNLGRNLAEGKGYTYHDQPHRLAYPGWPWVLSAVFRAMPEHAVFVAHAIVFVMGLAGLALMYRLMSLHTARPTAVLMTVALATSRTYYRYCFDVRSEMQFMLGVMAVLAGYEGIVRRGEARTSDASDTAAQPKPWLDWSLLLGGLVLGIVTRPTMWPVLAAVAMAIVWDVFRKRLSRRFLLAVLLPPVAAVLFLAMNPRQASAPSGLGDYEDFLLETMTLDKLGANLTRIVDPMASEALFGADFGETVRVGFVSLNVLGSLAALAAAFAAFRYRVLWGLIVVLTLIMMAVSVVQDRYFLPLLPMMVYGWWRGIRWINLHLPRRWGNVLFTLLFMIGAFPNAAKIGDLFIEQRHRNPMTAFRDGKFHSLPQVVEMLRQHVPSGAYVLAPAKTERILTFLARRTVLERRQVDWVDPDEDRVFVLVQREFDTHVPLKERLDDEIARVKGKHDKMPWVLYQVK
jgi:hypothetical protein